MNKVSLILFLIAGFFFFLQVTKVMSVIARIRAGYKSVGRTSLIPGWIALTCAIVGVVLK